MSVQKILWLALAGALGTLCRIGSVQLVVRMFGNRFPWGVVVVNLVGCFLFGLVWALSETRGRIGSELRMIILAGFMGAFTTFSSYIFDTAALAQASRPLAAVANLVFQNSAGLLLLFAGFACGRCF